MNYLVAAFYKVHQALRDAGINPDDVTIMLPERAIRRLEDELLMRPGGGERGTLVGINYAIKPGV